MLKLINHIIKEDKTRRGASLEVTQFTRNCPHQIVSIKNACILNNSELSRLSDWATTKNWWYYSCQVIFYSKFQVVAGRIPKSKNGKFNHQYNLLVKKRRGNWGYKINAEKNRSKDIKEKWKLYRSILGKYKYTSLELGVRSRPSPCCNAFFSGRLPCSGGTTGEGRSLYRLFTTALLWARLPCFIGIGNKLSESNLPSEHAGDRVG